MNNNNGALSFEATILNSQFNAAIEDMSNRIRALTNTAATESTKVNDAFGKLATLAGGAFAFTQLATLPQKLIQVRGEFQQLEIAFETMLGNKTKSDALFADVVKLAATTPFNLKEVATGAKQLLAYGVASEDVTKTMTKLGDIASGLSIPLNDLTYLYGTTRTQGRLFSADLNQFVGRGIPLIRLLSDQFGVAESEVKNLVEAGKVGFPEVEKAINTLTQSGGMFSGLMEKQSKSLTGLYSNFEDSVEQAFNNIGKSQEGLLASGIGFATTLVQNYEPILDVLKVLVATYGAYKAAIVATAAVQAIAASVGPVKLFFELAGTIKSAADAQALFNLVTGLNPYVVAGAALVGLITAVALFRDTTTQAEKAQQRIADVNNVVSQSLSGENAKIQVLTAQIKNENASREDRNNKLKELISIHPQLLNGLTLENIATSEGTKVINGYIEARKRQIETDTLKNELDQSIQRQLDAKNGKKDTGIVSTILGAAATAGNAVGSAISGVDFAKIQAQNTIAANKQIVQSEGELQKKILERVTALQSADAASLKSSDNTQKVIKKTVASYDEEIKAKKDAQQTASSSTEFKKLQADIDNLEKQKARITGAISKESKAAAKEADKSGPYGSAAYWDYIVSKSKEILEKTPVSNTGQIAKQQAILADAEKNAANARKKLAVISFDEELEEKKKIYVQYQLWVDNLGAKAANEQFDGLISQGKSYAEYLKQQINEFESFHPDSLTGQEQEKLVKLKVEYSDVTGAETPLEKFQKRLDDIRTSATSLTDEIERLKAVQSELGTTDMSPDSVLKRKNTQQQLNEASAQRKDNFRQYLLEVAGSEQKRLEIENRFKDLRIELEKRYGKEKGAAYIKALNQINEDEIKANKDQDVLVAEKSKEFKEFAKIAKLSNDEISRDKVIQARKDFDEFTKNLDKESEEYRQHLETLQNIEENYKAKSIKRWDMIAGAIGQLSEVLQEMGGGIGSVGSALSGLAGQYGNIKQAFATNKDGTTSMNQYAAAIQGVITIVGALVSASKKRHEEEKAFALARISFENDYQLALNQQIGQSYAGKDSIFNNDIEAKIKAGVAQYQDAQKKYQEAIDRLNDGQAKVRQKNVVDGKSVGQLAGAGAAAGAVIGGIVGVGLFSVATAAVGAVIGGAVGAISGLFAKKKKDIFGNLLEQYPDLILKGVDGWESLNVAMAKSLIATGQVDDKTKELLETTISYSDELDKSKTQILEGLSELTGMLGDSIRDALVGSFRDGTDAALAFGKAVGDVIADMASKLLFTSIFSQKFKDLEKSMVASYGVGGDGTIVDDLGEFFANGDVKQGVKDYTEGLELINQEMEKYGLKNVFGVSSGSSADPLQGSIQGVSQETASVLAGSINAIRITQADSNTILRNSLFQLTAIAHNTSYNVLLVDISKKLDKLNLLDSNFNREFGG
ncbi:tape measure protein [Dyadobacter sp. 3J3]|uniref:tape measure protein n=1 Tax=Dyadobacter sp. 3J3 TaxID=2606600 RepID=UPI00135C0724|nr:tape measure protein [Dyadobacter sp. 3J3]